MSDADFREACRHDGQKQQHIVSTETRPGHASHRAEPTEGAAFGANRLRPGAGCFTAQFDVSYGGKCSEARRRTDRRGGIARQAIFRNAPSPMNESTAGESEMVASGSSFFSRLLDMKFRFGPQFVGFAVHPQPRFL